MRGARKALAVAVKETRQILRDRRTLLILLFVPAFFLLVYGYALNFDIRHIRLAVQDDDRSSASRELVSAFLNSGWSQTSPPRARSTRSSTATTPGPCSGFPPGSARTCGTAVRRRCR